ncbi:MAG: hypothetical protein GY829_01440, partial [Gammaproteobacteria bacterium]|nr:hypothetical protein [Gammaproteobacteria bacterium]
MLGMSRMWMAVTRASGSVEPILDYESAVLALNPIAYYRLGESSGTTAVDEVGNFDGTYVNTPTLGAAGLLVGNTDTSIITDGISSYVNLNSALTALQQYNAGSVGFMFKLNSSGDQAIVANADNSTNDTHMLLYITESMCEFNYKYDGAGLGLDNFARTADVTLDLNTIYHIIFVQDDTVGVRIYLDDIELTTYTRQGTPNAKWWNS